MNTSKIIAVIPARKGSKRFPNKNTHLIGNKSLTEITIEQAINSNSFHKIIVTTDDPEIHKYSNTYKDVIFHKRSDVLSTDDTPLINVIKSIIYEFDISSSDSIFLLQVTNPLRTIDDIHNMISLYNNSNRDSSVISVSQTDCPMELLWKISKSGELETPIELTTIRKQDYLPSYKYNDIGVIDTAQRFLIEERTLFGKSPIPYIMPMWTGIYIDYRWQYELIKIIKNNEQFNQL